MPKQDNFSVANHAAHRILITGAGGGMSAGIIEVLGAAGHTILCADLSEESAEQAATRIRELGGVARAFSVDVTDEDSVSSLYERINREEGVVDVLINAAGILDRKYLVDHDSMSFEKSIDVNLNGPFRMIRHFGPDMVRQGWGRIVNISSIAGRMGYPYPSYAASKAGLSNLTRSLILDFWGSGVTINSVSPGVVDTPMVVQAVRDQVKAKVPTQEIVKPQEIGSLIAFLLTQDAKNINGADLTIDGGATQVFRIFDDRPDLLALPH